MQVQTLDAVFIRAPRREIHPVVADLTRWSRWWPGLDLRPTGVGVATVTLRPPGLLRRPQRWRLEVVKVRADLGIDLRDTGAVTGAAEFYYLDEDAGTVVHYAVRAAVPDARWGATVRDHRAGARGALDALKDRFEGDRLPRAEPDRGLLAEQRRAKAAFAEGVAASEPKQAEQAGHAAGGASI